MNEIKAGTMTGTINSNNLIYIDSTWFQYGGAVICQDSYTKEYKAYISGIKGSDRNIKEDIEQIMAFGSKLTKDQSKAFFPNIIQDETKTWKENNPEYAL